MNYQDEEIIALAEFTLEGTSAETNNSELRIHMIWQLGYSIDRQESSFEMSENLINRFIERNVAINIWPYTRELVASLTAKMSLTPLVLPTLKVLR
jgi:preprotein translocase subunit SecB